MATPEVIDSEDDGGNLLRKLNSLGIVFDYKGYRDYVLSVPDDLQKGRTPISYLIFKAQSEGFIESFYPHDN